MGANRFFTIMIVPEKSDQVRRIVIPSAIFKGGILSAAFLGVLAAIMVLDYANVMNQINENKKLKVENRELRQSVQVFKTKMVTIENTLDRVKTFVTKLRVITNIEDSGPLATPVSEPLVPSAPAAAPLPLPPALQTPASPAQPLPNSSPGDRGGTSIDQTRATKPADLETDTDVAAREQPVLDKNAVAENTRNRRVNLLAALMTETGESFTLSDGSSSAFVTGEFEKLDAAYDEVNQFALATEQETQDILEKLGEKRTLLASTPTRIPTLGYITSEYGVRINPYDSRRKMHEGLDIANHYGSDIIATADGMVSFAGVKPGYGKIVIIDHGNGIETRYAHSSKLFVATGEKVTRGQRIAAVGNTGHSTGPHCHYEVHANGLPVDPCWYILDQPAQCRSH